MLKFLFTLSLLALSPLASAQELPHDPASCPDLTGTFHMDNGAIYTFVSYVDETGMPILSFDDGYGALPYRLDGKKIDVGNGYHFQTLCHNQVIYDYYFLNDQWVRTDSWFLDADRNFILSMLIGNEGHKRKGIRQAL